MIHDLFESQLLGFTKPLWILLVLNWFVQFTKAEWMMDLKFWITASLINALKLTLTYVSVWSSHKAVIWIVWTNFMMLIYQFWAWQPKYSFTLSWPGYSQIHLFGSTTERKPFRFRATREWGWTIPINFISYIYLHYQTCSFLFCVMPRLSCRHWSSVNSSSRPSAALDGLRVSCIREERPVSEQAH